MEYFLLNGYNLTIFTNGMANESLKKLGEKFINYHYKIKISLDGFESTHNKIRGDKKSFCNAIDTIRYFSQLRNVETFISTTIMKLNILELIEFDQYISKNFPNCIHLYDFAFPSYHNEKNKYSFSLSEIKSIIDLCPESIKIALTGGGMSNIQRKYRCNGGITGAALRSNFDLNCCTGATEKQFCFGNILEKSLRDVWLHPSKEGKSIRKEKRVMENHCQEDKEKNYCSLN